MRMPIIAIILASLLLTFGCIQGTSARAQPLQTWDALPAFDPMHLSGAYAGRRECPMCAHGYDAGLLLFLPSDSDLADAAAWVAPLQQLRGQIDSERFRVFVILVGMAPQRALVEAVGNAHPQWYVGHLSGPKRAAAERDFGVALGDATIAYAFAQRRLLRQYSESGLLDPASTLAADARYAMQLLDWLHPVALPADADHDTPQGELWLAPSRLHGRVELSDAMAESICFLGDDGSALAHALLNVRGVDVPRSRPHWERTDAEGCLALAADPGRYRLSLYPLGQDRLWREVLRVDPADTPPVLGRCDGCEAVYDGRPAYITAQAQLTGKDEPGERLRLQGRVLGADGEPAAGIQVYAYQTDHAGSYPPLGGVGAAARRHGRLRGWAVSDAQGLYRFDTVRPGSYPGSTVPQHIHMHVIEPGRCTYYLDDVLFADDPHMAGKSERKSPRGGNGLTQPERNAEGSWQVHRDIHLGRNVADYADCGSGQS